VTVTAYEIYDEEDNFVCLIYDDRDAAYDYVQKHEPRPDSWIIKSVTRDGVGRE
jgi:hypothetical protein